MTRDRTAPLWWLLFSAGGTVSAMILPILIVITGIGVPAGWITAEELLPLVRHPLARVALPILVLLFLLHWAHRFRYALVDLGFGRLGSQGWLFYGAAVGGGLAAGLLSLAL